MADARVQSRVGQIDQAVGHEVERRHQQNGGPDAFSAARLDVLANSRDQLDLRLDVAAEFRVDPLKVFTDGLEDVGEVDSGVLHDCGACIDHNTIMSECQRVDTAASNRLGAPVEPEK